MNNSFKLQMDEESVKPDEEEEYSDDEFEQTSPRIVEENSIKITDNGMSPNAAVEYTPQFTMQPPAMFQSQITQQKSFKSTDKPPKVSQGASVSRTMVPSDQRQPGQKRPSESNQADPINRNAVISRNQNDSPYEKIEDDFQTTKNSQNLQILQEQSSNSQKIMVDHSNTQPNSMKNSINIVSRVGEDSSALTAQGKHSVDHSATITPESNPIQTRYNNLPRHANKKGGNYQSTNNQSLNNKRLQKQNYVKAPYQLIAVNSGKASLEFGDGTPKAIQMRTTQNQPRDKKIQEMMPQILNNKAQQQQSNEALTSQQMAGIPVNSGVVIRSRMQSQQQQSTPSYPGTAKKNDKYQMIGRPYKVKTKLPFYDGKGVYQGVKLGGAIDKTTSQGALQNKLKQFETAYNHNTSIPLQNFQTQNMSQREVAPRIDDQTNQLTISPRTAVKTFSQLGTGKTMKTVDTQPLVAYRTNMASSLANKKILRGNSSSSKLITPLDQPSLNNFKLKLEDELRKSPQNNMKDLTGMSNQKQRRVGGLQDYNKLAKEVPYIESVNGIVSNYRQSSKHKGLKPKILAASSPSRLGLHNEYNKHQAASSVSLVSNIECGVHADTIEVLNTQVSQLKGEIKAKDMLVAKLFESDEDYERHQSSKPLQKQSSQDNFNSNGKKSSNLAQKLKAELDDALKLLASRDSEILTLKKSVKQQAFAKCNEERTLYMNECMKLQSLLKIYGASSLKKNFKGVRVTQKQSTNNLQNDLTAKQDELNERPVSMYSQEMDKSQKQHSRFASRDLQKPSTSTIQSRDHQKGPNGALPPIKIQSEADQYVQQSQSNKIDELQARIEELVQENEQLDKGLIESVNQINLQTDLMNKLQDKYQSLEQNLTEKDRLFETQNEAIKQESLKHVHKIKKLEQDLEAERKKSEEQNNKLISLKQEHAKVLANFQSQMSFPEKNQQNSSEDQSSEIQQLQQIIVEKESEIETLKQEVQAQESTIENIKKEKQDVLLNFQLETSQLNAKSGESNQRQLDELQTKLDNSEQLNQSNIKEIEQIWDKLSQVDKQLEAEKEKHEKAKQQITGKSEENQKLIEEIEKLKSDDEKYKVFVENQRLAEETEKSKLGDQKHEDMMIENQRLVEEIKKQKLNANQSEEIITENQKLIQEVDTLKLDLKKQETMQAINIKKAMANKSEDINLLDQLGDLELQNAELESEVMDLERKVKNLNKELAAAKDGKLVFENLEDKSNFANIISKQGSLVENLQNEQNRVEELESFIRLAAEQTEASTQTDTIPEISEAVPLLAQEDTLKSVQQQIKVAKTVSKDDKAQLEVLKAKEKLLLIAELDQLGKTLDKKNEIINVTLESQEKLIENQAKQQEMLQESKAELEESKLDAQENEKKLVEIQAQLKKENEQSLIRQYGLREFTKLTLQEQFLVHKITQEQQLSKISKEQLQDQFLVPMSVQNLVESTPQEIFNILDSQKLFEVSMAELDDGFRMMKQILDSKNMDYKVLIFNLEADQDGIEQDNQSAQHQADEDKDADQIRLDLAQENLKAEPLLKEDFINAIDSNILNDRNLAVKIAVGCQQVAKSACLVHYWAFNALWYTFNCRQDRQRGLSMKQQLSLAVKEKYLNQKLIEDLERQKKEQSEKTKQEAEELRRQAEQQAEEMRKQAQKETEKMKKLAQEEAERARKQIEDTKKSANAREQEMAEAARLREEELLRNQITSQDGLEGENGDREGFSIEVYRYIKQSNELSVIVNIANASLYSIRNQCNVFSIDGRRLADGHQKFSLDEEQKDVPFVSLSTERDQYGEISVELMGKDFEEEVIFRSDFYGKVLSDMGLKRFIDLPEETAKLDNCLQMIGSLATDSQSISQTKFIRLEVLISAMRIHKYEYAGLSLSTKLKGVDFRTLTPKSMRIMNRLTRIVAQYQDKYQQKAKDGVKVSIQQIISAIFKGKIETRSIKKPQGLTSLPEGAASTKANEIRVQLLPNEKFYETITQLKIKTKANDVPNLSRFLRMNSEQPILLKKLISVVEEFLRNHYLKSFNFQKKRLDENAKADEGAVHPQYEAEAEEEYYYDEEVPVAAQEQQNTQQQTTAQFAQEDAEEYYYDEEEDLEQQQQQPYQVSDYRTAPVAPLTQEKQKSSKFNKNDLHMNGTQELKEISKYQQSSLTVGKDSKMIGSKSKLQTQVSPKMLLLDENNTGSNKNLNNRDQFNLTKHNARNSMQILPQQSSQMSEFAPMDSAGYRGEPEEAQSKYRMGAGGLSDGMDEGFKLPEDEKDWM